MSLVADNRPRFSDQQARNLASELYGLSTSTRELPSERDQNFQLMDGSGRTFVLKIASASDSKEVLDFQNKAMQHLAARAPSLNCPRVCPSVNGEEIVPIRMPGSPAHWVRLLTYVPGRFFAEVKPHTPDLLGSLGAFFGRMDAALSDFSHPAAHRQLNWNMSDAGTVIRRHVDHITDPARRALIRVFLQRFEAHVLPVMTRLRQSVIHNDGNDLNVLVSTGPPGGDAPWSREVSGVIDFGDMLHCVTVCDLAIAAAYAILGKRNPIEAASHVVRGYNGVLPLTELESEVIFTLICIRLCTSLSLSAYQQSQEPQIRYLSISERLAWEALQRLSGINPSFAHYSFRHACGMEPCPQSPSVAGWLRKNENRVGRVVEPQLCRPDALVLDLGVGSTESGNAADLADTRKFTKNLFDRMRSENASVGIGRYNEARLCYTGESYQTASDNGPEWRTVHTGIDLFLPPGSPVYAPLDGTVHSFADNARRYDYGPTIILQHHLPEYPHSLWTLYGHLSGDSLEGLYAGMPVQRGTRIAKVGDFPTNGDWPPHLHFQIITDMLGMEGDFPGVASPAARDVWLSLCPDPNLILKSPELARAAGRLNRDRLLALRTERIGPSLSISYRKPLHIVRGFMQHLYDVEARPYLDTVNNVAHVGHCHPRVVRALAEQAAVLNTNTRYLHENLVSYAQRLCATLPKSLCVCYFVNSGSEANDLALRLARTHTGREGVVVLDGAYHGNLTSLIEISPYKFDGPGGAGAASHVRKVLMPDDYRGRYRREDPLAGKMYVESVRQAIAEAGNDVACFICESILSCAGQIVLPAGYLAESYRHMRSAGAVCIADEVQVGLGRVGSHFWAFETQGVVPDIVTMGKPIGNGHPMAAVVTTREIADSFNNGMEYFNTYGGNPVSCAVGLAVLDVIRDEGLQENANIVGAHLKAGLVQLMQRHRIIGDVRGNGLFLGVELVRDRLTLEPAAIEASYVVERMKELGILSSIDGPLHNVLKIKPPMVFNEGDSDCYLSALDTILAEDFVSR
ncbi:MAG TPA: aminotransferase class III-fold pyridoxal phosphate-dependent enzyme [Acidobacteriota bacterium]|nr:aminotransferase class III-fold pyridoxal phosphate-dependent enzyme [Acidobacteriota bacterium]